MPFSSGTFSRLYTWVTDAANSIKIRADRMDAEFDGIATGLSSAVLKDGTQTLTANIPFNGMKITGYGSTNAPNARTDVPSVGQVQDSGFVWGGTSGGSANAQTITLAPAVTGQSAGRQIEFIAGFTNTGACTLSPNGVSAAAFRKMTAAGLVALTGGEIVAGNRVRCTDTGSVYILADKPEISFGADIASATTTDIGAATGEVVTVTGTTTITGFGSTAVPCERTVIFSGALILTHNATSLILPGAANITTAAGDVALMVRNASGNWRCASYTKADGTAVVVGSKGADIASATTTDLSAATGDYVDVTGTTTIAGLGTAAAGIERTVRFTGAGQITHNATSLILPSAANITRAANDRAIFRSLGSGNWICIAYQKADGSALVSTGTSFTVKTGTYTAVAGDKILADMTASAWTLTLPASASAGDTIEIQTYGSYALTIGRNGHKIGNVSHDGVVTGNTNASFKLVYLNATYGWVYGGAL
jgi:hypothetical protein